MNTPTRGERNNNPGNIEHAATFRWRGELAPDPSIESRFARFDTAHNGIRALARNLLTYYRTHHLSTVMDIIYRWAPAGENNTGAYVQHVANQMGVRIQDPLDLEDPPILRALTRAIIVHENARCVYDDEAIAAAVCDALDAQTQVPAPPLPAPDKEPPMATPAPAPQHDGNWLQRKLTPEEYAAVTRWLRAERLTSAIKGASRSWTVRLNTLAGMIALAWPHIAPYATQYLGQDAVALLVALYAAANIALRAKTDKPLAER